MILESRASPNAHHAFRWLAHLGMPGVFGVSIIDSSVIPMPVPGSTDLLLLWLVSHRSNPWGLVACAVAGSLLGGYGTWKLGKQGGDATLRRHVPERLLDRIKRWVERHPMLAIFVPSILPPPIPLSPFLLAAGALKISLRRFMFVFALARTLRYGFIAWLSVRYSRPVIHVWSATLSKYAAPIAWSFALILAAGASYAIWKLRRERAPLHMRPALETSPRRSH